MKNPAIMLAAVGLATAAMYVSFRSPAVPPVDPSSLHEGTLVMNMPPEEVFKRALWRRPSPEDKILHAERREWTTDSANGPAHWQWFLAVEPGAALKTWLRERHPFSTRPATTAVVKGAPAWFPGDLNEYEIEKGGPGGSLVFLFSRDGRTFYATDSGAGFTPGAPAPVAASPPPGAPGRLPQTPPPDAPPQ